MEGFGRILCINAKVIDISSVFFDEKFRRMLIS
jgi:hypothetical protein